MPKDKNCWCKIPFRDQPELSQAVVDEMVEKGIWWQEFRGGEAYGIHCNACGHSGGWPGWSAELSF